MLIPLIPIGNSRGVRLPKSVIRQLGFENGVDMTVDDGALVLRPPAARSGWAEAFAAMHTRGEDKLVIADVYTPAEFSGNWKW